MNAYEVDSARDDTTLAAKIDEWAAKGGRIVSVNWIPARPHPKNPNKSYPSKYVIVVELKKA